MPWPLKRRESVPRDNYGSYNSVARNAGGAYVPVASTAPCYKPTGRAVYVRAPLPLSVTPDERLTAKQQDKSWYAKALQEPPKLSQKKHTSLGRALKKWHGLSAANAARNVLSAGYVPYLSGFAPAYRAMFETLPASRRRAVSDALRTLNKGSRRLPGIGVVQPLATLMARRTPVDLLRDTASTQVLLPHFCGEEIEEATAIFAWLEGVPVESYDATIQTVDRFLKSKTLSTGYVNEFFRAASLIGAKHLAEAFAQVTFLTDERGWPRSVSLLTLLACVPYSQREALVHQIDTAGKIPSENHLLGAPSLLSEVPAGERDDLAMWLANFFTTTQQARRLVVCEFFTALQKLPHARRELYLQSLAGCLVAAYKPTHRPNDVAVATLWLYYGHIDHRAPLDDYMELLLGTTIRRFMALDDPLKEAPALIQQAKSLAGAQSKPSAATLEAVASLLVSIPPQERERFAVIAAGLCQGAPQANDRISIAELLANHAPQHWSVLSDACKPLRAANLYAGLVVEGVQAVLTMATPETAGDVCRSFLQGGMANAARCDNAYTYPVASA